MEKIEVSTGTACGDADSAVCIIKRKVSKCTKAYFTPPEDLRDMHKLSEWPLVLECDSNDEDSEKFEMKVLFLPSTDEAQFVENAEKVLTAAGFVNAKINILKPKVFIK